MSRAGCVLVFVGLVQAGCAANDDEGLGVASGALVAVDGGADAPAVARGATDACPARQLMAV